MQELGELYSKMEYTGNAAGILYSCVKNQKMKLVNLLTFFFKY